MSAEASISTVRLIIPTTNGPVEVLYLADDPELSVSIVCINGTSTQAGMSGDYGSFVRRGTGVIEKYFGPANFRLDLSERVDVGDSWKLSAFIAHALEAQQRLHQSLNPDAAIAAPSVLVWATGAVRSVDLAVGEVAHVAEKLRHSLSLFATARRDGLRCIVFLPHGNAGDGDPATMARLAALGVEVVPLRQVDGALELLGLPKPARASSFDESGAGAEWSGNPFRGLEPFGIEHRRVFFGRSRAREEVVERLRTAAEMGRAFVLVHGRSGAGKSSLAMAGVAGDIAARTSGETRWQIASLRPGSDPLAALAVALAPWAGATPVADAPGWIAALKSALAAAQARVVLVVDQLEELFAAGLDDAGAVAVRFGNLIELLAESGSVWVIATIRSDQMAGLDTVPALARLASSDRTFRLDRPTPFELSEMVTQPAALAGLSFKPTTGESLPDRLAGLAATSPDSLPLLQAVLSRLAERAEAGGVLTLEAYRQIGGFEGAISRWADESLFSLAKNGISDALVDRVLADLVRIDVANGTVLAREAEVEGDDTRRAVFEALIASRVVSVGVRADGRRAVRVAHEALITHWDRLRVLSERLRASLITRDWLEQAASAWHRGGRNTGDVLGNSLRVAEAQGFMDEALVDPPAHAKEFVAASVRRLEDEQQRQTRLAEAEADRARAELERQTTARKLAETTTRQQRYLLIAAAVAVVLAGASAWTFSYLAGEADQQRQLADAAAAEAAVQKNVALTQGSKLLAMLSSQSLDNSEHVAALQAAIDAVPDSTNGNERPLVSEAAVALNRALREAREGLSLTSDTSWSRASFTPDGSIIATRYMERDVYRFAPDGTQTTLFRMGSVGDNDYALSIPGTSALLVCGNELAIRDSDTGLSTVLASDPDAFECMEEITFSPDGRLAWMGGLAPLDTLPRLIDIVGSKILPVDFVSASEGKMLDLGFVGPDPAILANSTDGLTLYIGGVTPRKQVYAAEFVTPAGEEGDWPPPLNGALSPDGSRVAISWPTRKLIEIYRTDTAESVATISGLGTNMTLSPDNELIILESLDGTYLLDATSSQSLDDISPVQTGCGDYCLFAFSPDSSLVASTDASGLLSVNSTRFYDAWSLRVDPGNSYASTLEFSPDGKSILVGFPETLSRWQVDPAALIQEYGPAGSFILSADGTRMAMRKVVTDATYEDVSVVDVASGTELSSMPIDTSLAGYFDGRYLIAIGQDDEISVWDTDTGKSIFRRPFGNHNLSSRLSVSPDGRTVTLVDPVAGEIEIHDTKTGELLPSPALEGLVPGAPALESSNGRILVARSGGDGRTAIIDGVGTISMVDDTGSIIWSVATDMFSIAAHSTDVTRGDFDLAFTPDGANLLLSAPGYGTLYDARSGEVVRSYVEPGTSAEFYAMEPKLTPDGRHIVATGVGDTAIILDLMSGMVLDGFEAGGEAPHMLPDGTLLTLSGDRVMRWHYFLDPAEGVAFARSIHIDSREMPKLSVPEAFSATDQGDCPAPC